VFTSSTTLGALREVRLHATELVPLELTSEQSIDGE
jgi:hypothetical protein